MLHEDFIRLCKRQVAKYENSRVDVNEDIDRDDVFVVWSCKTLQNSKALMSAKHKGAYYYEFTLNGDKRQIYMDAYKKVSHKILDKHGDELECITK